MKNGMQRTDDTPIHKALREALANCLTNADFYGSRGLVIRNNLNEIILENPGGFRIDINEAKSGGVSSPRNSVILRMFNMLDIGERTGSGIPSIYQNWEEQNAGTPVYNELFNPERTILSLPLEKTDAENDNGSTSDSVRKSIGRGDKNGKVPITSANGTNLGTDGTNGIDHAPAILSLIKKTPNLTYDEMAKELGLSRRTLAREIKSLRDKDIIKRVGTTRTGHWEILINSSK